MKKSDLKTNLINFSGTIILIALAGYAIWGAYYDTSGSSYHALRSFWLSIGDLALVLALLSASLWGVKKFFSKSKNTSGTTLMWLRQSHIIVGWLALAMGVGHSSFFLINMSMLGRHIGSLYTGLAALTSMLLLIIVGILYQCRKIKVKTARSWHLKLALAFTLLLIIHI